MVTDEKARPCVILVDDDEAVLAAVRFSLEVEGIAVMAFSDGAELLENPHLAASGCLVFDYSMPKLNGLDLLDALRRKGVTSPAVLITANPTDSIRRRVASNGVVLVEKPALTDLPHRVRQLLAAE
jgi:FixJ family two-component response regulator